MSNSSTRLTIDNSTGVTLTTLDMKLSGGQFMTLCLQLQEQKDRTIHQTELALLQRAKELIEHMLRH